MSISQRDILFMIKNLSTMDTALEMLMEFEKTLDQAGVFAYQNWEAGELVKGPEVDRYWFTTEWMWPRKLMPDPDAGLRLLKYDCRVSFREEEFIEPVRVLNPETDIDTNAERPRTAKKRRVPVWVVTISMPRRFVDDSHEGVFEISGEEIDVDDIYSAWEGEEFEDDLDSGATSDARNEEWTGAEDESEDSWL